MQRVGNRKHNQLRSVSVTYNVFSWAPSSVLLQIGNTKVLCAVSMQNSVPNFLKGTKTGWLNAEYAMLPTATHSRINRPSANKKNGRSIEISRLIGRCLRSIVDLNKLGERTIVVDCDVLQADGSTRVACITAASLALKSAVSFWISNRDLAEDILLHDIAAVSVGVMNERVFLDLSFQEDSFIDADYNVILTRDNDIVEIQGTAERAMVSWQVFEKIRNLACQGVQDLFKVCDQMNMKATSKKDKTPLFSLLNRQKSLNS